MSFQIYLTNKIGAAGVGIFQLIMSVYMFALTVAISGIRLATTRLVTEEIAGRKYGGVAKSVRYCMFHALFFSSIAAVTLFLSAPMLGANILGDIRTIIPLKILAAGLPVTAVCAVVNGYFTAVRKSYKTAIFQIVDEAVTIYLTVAALAVLMPKGLEYACIAIVASSTVAELFTSLFLFAMFLWDKRKYSGQGKYSAGLFGKMLGISLPVAFSAYARTGLNSLQHLLIPRGLKMSGASSEKAMTAYGTIHGMALPILLFPSVFLQTLSELVVPEFSECKTRERWGQIDFMVDRLLRIVAAFSIGIAGICIFFAKEFAQTIYGNTDVVFFLRIFGPLVPVMYCDTVVDGILKGLGEQVSVMRYNIMDAAMGTFMALTVLPALGIDGYIITIFVTEIFNFYLSFRKLVSISHFQFHFGASILVPMFSIGLSLYLAKTIVTTLLGINSVLPALLSGLVLGIAIYLLFLYVFRCFTGEDLKWFQGLSRHSTM